MVLPGLMTGARRLALAAIFTLAAAPAAADSLKSWGLSWTSTKAELAPTVCQQIYDEIEVCQLPTVPRPLPMKDYYQGEFSPEGKLLGLSYVSKILPAPKLIEYFNQLAALQTTSAPRRTLDDFQRCYQARDCAQLYEEVQLGPTRLEYYLTAPSFLPFSLANAESTAEQGRIVIRQSRPAVHVETATQPEFDETLFALTAWLAPQAPQPFNIDFLQLAWRQKPAELLARGIRCHDIQIVILCHPDNKLPLPAQTRFFSVIKDLGLMKMDLLYHYDAPAAPVTRFEQVAAQLVKKFTNLTLVPPRPEECNGEYCPHAAQRFLVDYQASENYAAEIQLIDYRAADLPAGYLSIIIEKQPTPAEAAAIARKMEGVIKTMLTPPPDF